MSRVNVRRVSYQVQYALKYARYKLSLVMQCSPAHKLVLLPSLGELLTPVRLDFLKRWHATVAIMC